MIDNASATAIHVLTPKLRVVPRIARLRDQVDRRRNYYVVKRSADILFSLLFIGFVLSWMLPLMALLIKIHSRGPVFFVQRRVGRGGRSFRCYKFRTMVTNAEADLVPAGSHDNRITSLGAVLRTTNIDEFPQFFNILRGDMSLVGPRPHMHADCRRFSSLIPTYKSRNMVKPGLTGLAQIKGYHGPATTTDSIRMRYLWDTYYISNAGAALDFRILVQTLSQKCSIRKKKKTEALSGVYETKPGLLS